MFIFLFSSLSQEAHCVIMGIIGEGHWISGELLRDNESSSCNSFANFCAKPKALDCDVTTAGVELFMGRTPTVQFYCHGLIMCGPFGLSAYALDQCKHQCRCYQPGHISASTGNLTGCMQECSFFCI